MTYEYPRIPNRGSLRGSVYDSRSASLRQHLGIYTPPINEQLAIIPFNPDGFNDVNLDLGRVLAKLPGTETFIAVSQNEESAVLHQAIYNKTTNYYNITENWINFIGSITGNVAVAENSNGEAQFYAVPAYTNRDVLMVYTNNKTLMPDSGDINFDGDKQVLVARQIGSTGEKYLLVCGCLVVIPQPIL